MSLSFAEYRLPRGRHGIPREQVEANQRWRLLGACADVLRERGYARTTVAQVTSEAAVSKATFYAHFDGLADCILQTYRVATRSFLELVAESCERSSEAPLAQLMQAVLEVLAAEPSTMHVLTDPALDDVPGVADTRAGLLECCVSRLASPHAGLGGNPDAESRIEQLLRGTQGLLAHRLSGAGDQIQSQELAQILSLLSAPPPA